MGIGDCGQATNTAGCRRDSDLPSTRGAWVVTRPRAGAPDRGAEDMVRIRLRRVGRKNAPVFRIVVADSQSPRNGRFVEVIGQYSPREERLTELARAGVAGRVTARTIGSMSARSQAIRSARSSDGLACSRCATSHELHGGDRRLLSLCAMSSRGALPPGADGVCTRPCDRGARPYRTRDPGRARRREPHGRSGGPLRGGPPAHRAARRQAISRPRTRRRRMS